MLAVDPVVGRFIPVGIGHIKIYLTVRLFGQMVK